MMHYGHGLALVLIAIGIVSDEALVFRLGAAAGWIGAACFAAFADRLWRRLDAHL